MPITDIQVVIRAYQPQDRAMLRQICCDVADRGDPIEGLFPDRALAADLLTNYYTEYEPQASFVAESKGRVIGYINGCVDNRRYGLALFFIIVPLALIKAFIRGVFFRREFWLMIAAMMLNWPRLFQWRKKSFHSHQGHFHIGIAAGFRQQHLGKQLIEAFSQHARINGTQELLASVHAENIKACQFFEHLGFELQEDYVMNVARGEGIEQYKSILYVKKLS